MREELIHIKTHSVANNIVITGLPETPNEAATEIFNTISTTIKSESTHKNLSELYRMPARRGIKPIMVKFVSRLEKEAWLVNGPWGTRFINNFGLQKTSGGTDTGSPLSLSSPDDTSSRRERGGCWKGLQIHMGTRWEDTGQKRWKFPHLFGNNKWKWLN